MPSKVFIQLHQQFSQDHEIFAVLAHDLKLASLIELQTVYSTEDVVDMLEIQEAYDAIKAEVNKQMNKE